MSSVERDASVVPLNVISPSRRTIAEIARKQGPIGLEKVDIDDPFLAKGIRYVADGYDGNFIRDNLERDRITRGFLNVGFHQVKKGDKVCLLSPNAITSFVTFWAVLKAGGVIVPLNGMLDESSLARLADSSDGSFFFADAAYADLGGGIRFPKTWHSHQGYDDNYNTQTVSSGHNAFGGTLAEIRLPLNPSATA